MLGRTQSPATPRHQPRWRTLTIATAVALAVSVIQLGQQASPASVISAPVSAATSAAAAAPHNPIFRQNTPDPGILRVGRFYYLYTTSNGPDEAMPIYSSADLRTWTRVGQIFRKGKLPSWSRPQGDSGIYKFWGPEVHKIGSRYVAYYSTIDETGRFSIGAATARNPSGPFWDRGKIVWNPDFGVIDPSYFRDPKNGKQYLLWKDNTNALDPPAPTHIVLHELTSNGLSLSSGSSHRLITDDVGWEGKVVEAPSLVYRHGFYYLFYSGNDLETDYYAVGFARSEDIEGRYEKPGDLRGPILKSDQRFDGPGGQFILRAHGRWLIFYHARERQTQSKDRYLMLDQIWWDSNGLPHVNDGTPSD